MKTNLVSPLFLVLLLILPACSSVTTIDPLSIYPEAIDKEKLEGAWQLKEHVVHIKFNDDGVAKIAGLEWRKGQFQLNHAEAIVTKGELHNFISLRIQDNDGTWDGYYPLPYRFTDHGDLIIWPPVAEAFEDAISQKKLAGTIEGDDITISDAPEKLLELFNATDNWTLFDYKEPVILKRVSTND